jgi:hypothetical protein
MLLSLVAKTSGNEKWTEVGSIEWHTWQQEYNRVVAEYQRKFQLYLNKWLASDAGKKYEQMVKKSRYTNVNKETNVRDAHVALPTPLIWSDIAKLRYPPDSEEPEDQFTGIPWGAPEIYHIFESLSNVSKVGRTNIDLVYPGGRPPMDWFSEDVKAMEEDFRNNFVNAKSWYIRFNAIATTTLLNLIHMHFGFNSVASKPTKLTDEGFHNLLMQIQTPGWDKKPPLLFKFIELDLDGWVSFFVTEGFDGEPLPKDGPEASDTLRMEFDSIEDGQFPLIQSDDGDMAEFGAQVEEEMGDEQVRLCEESNIDTTEHTAATIVSAASFPPAQLAPEGIPAIARTFNDSNVYGRVQLMFTLLDSEKKRLDLLRVSCANRTDLLNHIKRDLLEKVIAVRQARAAVGEGLQEMDNTEKEVKKLRSEIQKGERDPAIKNFIQRDRDMRKSLSTPAADSQEISRCHLLPSGANFSGRWKSAPPAPIEKGTHDEKLQEAAAALLNDPEMSTEAIDDFFNEVINKPLAGERMKEDKEGDEASVAASTTGSQVGSH